MKTRLLPTAGTIALVVAVAACGDSGSDSADDAACTPDSSVQVAGLDKLTFDSDAYSADSGCVEIEYTNDGSVAHTLLIKRKPGFKLSVGRTDSGALELEPGTYTLFCDVPGHEAAGMHAELTVS